MKRQRGNIYWIFALAISAGAVLWGAIVAWNSYTSGLDKQGYDRGVAETAAVYEKRDNEKLLAATTRVHELEGQARAKENNHARALVAIGTKLSQEKANAKSESDRITADISAGRLVRRDGAFQARTRSPGGDGGPVGATPTGTGGSDGGAACELSEAAQRSVLEIGADADKVAEQLAACQAVVTEDRRLCGAGQ